MVCQLIACAVIFFSIVKGFNAGFMRQLPAFIAIAFGAICTHIFLEPGISVAHDLMPWLKGRESEDFICSNVAVTIIFVVVYSIFRFATSLLGYLARAIETGMFNRIVGALFGLFRGTFWLSLAFNLAVCIQPRGELSSCARSDDGNLAGEVLLLAPAVLGGQDVEDLNHRLQLEDAKKISLSEGISDRTFVLFEGVG